MIRKSPARTGFTLLEVVLASAIAVLLLGGMYKAFDIVLVRNDIARDEAAHADLTRAIVNRLTMDLSAPLGPLPPMSGGGVAPPADAAATDAAAISTAAPTVTSTTTAAAAPATGTGTATAATTASTSEGDSASMSSGTSGTSADGTAATSETPVPVNLPFHAGVIGSNTHVTLFASRIPQSLTDPAALANPDVTLPGDLRRVTYYLGSAGGLCRQERPWVTADGVGNSSEPDTSTEAVDLIAPEVASATFEYFDGTGWVADWDGSIVGEDGTVGGPPRAVRVTLTFEFPDQRGGTPEQRKVVHVFPIRAANGLYIPPTAADDGTDTTTTDTGGM